MGVKCELCGDQFSRSDNLKRHVLSVHGGGTIFKCDECDYQTPRKFDLTRHVSKMHSDLHFCEQCVFSSETKDEYMEHLKTHESVTKRKREEDEAGPSSFKCMLCSNRCNEKKDLLKHVNEEHNDEVVHHCNKCNYQTKS